MGKEEVVVMENNDLLLEFIEQSNKIEGIDNTKLTKDSLEAWRYLATQSELSDDVIKRTQKLIVQNQNKYFKEKKEKKHLRRIDIGQYRQEQVAVGRWDIIYFDPIKETFLKEWKKTGECMDYKWIESEIKQWIVNANDVVFNGKNEDTDFITKLIKEQHIRFEKIHPFIDGNGRVGRMLMNWQRVKIGLDIVIVWEDNKQEYYQWFKEGQKDGKDK